MGLKVGQVIPQFSLPDQDGKLFNSNDIVGKKPFVIFFYPKDYTPGCTLEVCSFRDSYEEFTELGATVIGISSDSENTHRRFASKYKLPFKLLADRQKKVQSLFKVESKLFNLLPGRETYVVSKEGVILMAFNSINASLHMKKALNTLKKLK
ncbi:peroxiredoxin [uncultured Eudoraea sp.]|jgi:peroxiredoxin Q/BCP|uniref:peroxiredoxin n=1 Tax=uncultured Eudoraea sp. TaxID=1035614 RepID=UPI002633E524|nr:peroxiredoxin [uncultured Eudoraea sp.]